MTLLSRLKRLRPETLPGLACYAVAPLPFTLVQAASARLATNAIRIDRFIGLTFEILVIAAKWRGSEGAFSGKARAMNTAPT